MSPADLLQMLRARPFRPFRIYLDDGTLYRDPPSGACHGQRRLGDSRFP